MLQDVTKPPGVDLPVTGGSSTIHETSLEFVESPGSSSALETANLAFPKQHQNHDEQLQRLHDMKEIDARDDAFLFTAYDDLSDDEFHRP